MVALYVDADACPVKDEVIRVAERHGLEVYFVSNEWIRGPDAPWIHRIVVAEGPDVADDWIAERVGPGDVAVTTDVPLASRCLKAGARALRPNGKAFTEQSMGMTLATRDLMTELRSSGEITGGPAPFTKQDRSRFLDGLEREVQAAKRQTTS